MKVAHIEYSSVCIFRKSLYDYFSAFIITFYCLWNTVTGRQYLCASGCFVNVKIMAVSLWRQALCVWLWPC